MGPPASDAVADEEDGDGDSDESSEDFTKIPTGPSRAAPASPTEDIESVRSAKTARTAGSRTTAGGGTGSDTVGTAPSAKAQAKAKRKGEGKAKAKAKAKARGDSITDRQSAAGRQKAQREMQSYDKVIYDAQLMNKYMNSATGMEAKPAEVRKVLSNLNKRLDMDIRWVYMGEDLLPDDESGRKVRSDAFENLKKKQKKPLELSVKVLECAVATQQKDSINFSHDTYRAALGACLENNVGVGANLLHKFKQRESQLLLKHELQIFEDGCLSEARRVLTENAPKSLSVPPLTLHKWASSVSNAEGECVLDEKGSRVIDPDATLRFPKFPVFQFCLSL